MMPQDLPIKTTLYVYYDRVSMLFSSPFPSVNDGTAVRWFKAFCANSSEVNGPDLDLYRLGVLDQRTGEMECEAKPEFIYRMSEVVSDG